MLRADERVQQQLSLVMLHARASTPYTPRDAQVASDAEGDATTMLNPPDGTIVQIPAELKDEFGEPIEYDPEYRRAIGRVAGIPTNRPCRSSELLAPAWRRPSVAHLGA